ncbi:hypothetical protein [Aureimonas sp. SK2]|uniref:hypothetical protein n=1 Tax=Aureimonas sp. SK2 TaxID=3015992 RepID=UPI0024442F49|nr:hypothetical protein [Aureimonas sp. SK2]
MSTSYSRDERPVDRDVDRTVVVTDRGRSGGSGWFIAGIVVVALVIGGFFLFGGNLGTGVGSSAGGGTTNITVDTPDINVGSPAAPAGGASSGSATPAPAN